MTVALSTAPGTEAAGEECGGLSFEARERRMRALFEANARPLRLFLMRLTRGQYETSEDLVQETMLRAWRRMEDLPDEAESLRRWLFTVARNLAIDAARARLSRPVEVVADSFAWAGVAEDSFDGLLDRQVLDDVLRRLSPEQRSVLVALYYRDASVAEAAAGMGIPEGTVRSRSFYALRTVRQMLGTAA